MKRQIVGPVLGKLVHQLPGVVTLAPNLRLMHTIAHYKDISENYNFWKRNIDPSTHVAPRFPKKHHLGAQSGSRSSGPKKLLKIVSCATIKETKTAERDSCGGPNGIGGWPPTSTWIIPPPLGSSGPHCTEFLHEMRKLLLNLVPGEPLALVKELACFDNSI